MLVQVTRQRPAAGAAPLAGTVLGRRRYTAGELKLGRVHDPIAQAGHVLDGEGAMGPVDAGRDLTLRSEADAVAATGRDG